MKLRTCISGTLLLLLILLLTGCGAKPTSQVPDGYKVSGKISISSSDTGLPGVTLNFGKYGSATTGSDGRFTKTGLAGTITVTPARNGWTFQPQSVSVTGFMENVNFVASGQDIPYLDPNVIVPIFNNGSATFDLPTPSAANTAWIALFPQTQTEGNYSFTFTGSPSTLSAGASNAVSLRLLGGGSTRNTRRATMDHQFESFLRLSDSAYIGHRSELMRRARLDQTRTREFSVVGEERTFQKFDQYDSFVSVTATLKSVGTSSLIYVDNAHPVDQWIVDDFSSTFDSFSPLLTGTFGEELDVDGNNKIVILLTPLPSSTGTRYGYFWSGNEFSNYQVPNSNATDMIYINPLTDQLSTLKGTLAHEYQHYLHWSRRMSNGTALEDIWLDEGFSMLAMDLVGYGYDDGNAMATTMVNAWLQSTWTWSLTNWGQDNASYGGNYMFAKYLYDHYGSSALKAINESADGGTKAVNDVVGGTFGEVFRSFVGSIAYLYHGKNSSDSRLSFPSSIPIDGTVFQGLAMDSTKGGTATSTIRPWGVQFIWIFGGAANTRAHVNISSSTGGNFGAIAITGFN